IMLRKALALLCCVSLVLTGPGARSLFGADQDAGDRFMWTGGATPDRIEVPTLLASVPVDLSALSRNIQGLSVDPDMRSRAREIIERRVIPFLGDRRPPQVEAAIRRFNERVGQPHANRELLLTELFENLEAFASEMEASTNYRDVLQDNDQMQRIRITNAV